MEPSKVKLEFELSRIFLCLIWGADQAGPKIGVDMQSHPHHDQIVSLKLVVYIKRTLDVRFAVVRVPLQLSGHLESESGTAAALGSAVFVARRPPPPPILRRQRVPAVLLLAASVIWQLTRWKSILGAESFVII